MRDSQTQVSPIALIGLILIGLIGLASSSALLIFAKPSSHAAGWTGLTFSGVVLVIAIVESIRILRKRRTSDHSTLEEPDFTSASRDPDMVIRIDAEAMAMIADHRQRFSSAPLGVWGDCIDEWMGFGFGGVSGKFSATTFTADGKGLWEGEYESIRFEWRTIGERVIEVRCMEHIPAPEGWTDEEMAEDQQWHRVAYDFVVPKLVGRPTIFDVDERDVTQILDGTIDPFFHLGFLTCFGVRFGGPEKLRRDQFGEGSRANVAQ